MTPDGFQDWEGRDRALGSDLWMPSIEKAYRRVLRSLQAAVALL
ncbi:MAG: hypothetical protein AAGA01_08290 [Cyanobacteria bacterium P01_E01_bin.43]